MSGQSPRHKKGNVFPIRGKGIPVAEEDSEEGGKGGKIAFSDFLSGSEGKRDDLLTATERATLLKEHAGLHHNNVKAQMVERQNRASLKQNPQAAQNRYGFGAGSGNQSSYRSHPVLGEKAQFSGEDNKTTVVPEKYEADTNNAEQEQLQNRYQLTHQPNLPFRPSTPTLKPPNQ
ncbi:MAG TPA: hypothetical protein VNC84_03420 [Gammaproteobacteria bacterium]|jgi:hypothetical protein|nr:hypothetical protein [Gammaproteobacteria bacterium]